MSKRKVGPRGDAAMGARIAAARQARGWSQARAAEEIGVSKAAVSKWETGDRMPLAGALRKISDVLGVSMDELAKGPPAERLAAFEKGVADL